MDIEKVAKIEIFLNLQNVDRFIPMISPIKVSAFNPVEQRILGLFYILEGFCRLIWGSGCPKFCLPYTLKVVKRLGERESVLFWEHN